MTKSKKIVLIKELAADGKTKAEIAKKLGVTSNAFYKNKSYRDAFILGELEKRTYESNIFAQEHGRVGTKHGMSAKDFLEVHATKLDTFELTKRDFKDIKTMAAAINRVAIAESNAEITSTRAKNMSDRLTNAIAAASKVIEFQEFQEWKNGLPQ